MDIRKKIGLFCLLSYGIFFLSPTGAMDPPDEGKKGSLFSYNFQKRKTSTPPIINLISPDDSQEDSLDQILLNLQPTSNNSLKRKREKNNWRQLYDSHSLHSVESSQDSDSQGSAKSSSYESESENSFVADGHYGSDEEDPYGTEDSRSYSNDDGSTSSSNEQYQPAKKYLKKEDQTRTATSRPRRSKRDLTPSKKKRSKSHHSSSSSSIGQDSEREPEEDLEEDALFSLEKAPDFIQDMVKIGLHVKLLSNVYLGNVREKANIFLPWYKANIELLDGQVETHEGWFKTDKAEICVFASGGLHHIWEKNVRHVNGIFFGGEKIKIIRAHWIQKHLYKNMRETTREEDFSEEKQRDLHSEYYYDLFFREYFILQLQEKAKNCAGTLKDLTIHAFSWWEVCNMCEGTLSNHKDLLGPEVSLSYKILACKPYNIQYPPASCVENNIIQHKEENKAWRDLWGKINYYTEKKFENSKEKRKFWTETYEGLEVCKWFGQAFSEREIGLDGRRTKAKEGSILTFYEEQQPQKIKILHKLLSYLRDKNWDLSCWYKGPRFVDKVQPKWKKHWKQVCVPHFGWEEVHYVGKKKEEGDKRKGRRKLQDRQVIEFEDKKDWNGNCEMCGYEGIENVYRIFHPKYHGSEKFLKLSKEEQREQECSQGFTHETLIAELPLHLQKKRLQSLCVGSECVKVLSFKKSDIDEWRENKNDEVTASKTHEQAKRLQQNDRLDQAEKGLRKKNEQPKRTS